MLRTWDGKESSWKSDKLVLSLPQSTSPHILEFFRTFFLSSLFLHRHFRSSVSLTYKNVCVNEHICFCTFFFCFLHVRLFSELFSIRECPAIGFHLSHLSHEGHFWAERIFLERPRMWFFGWQSLRNKMTQVTKVKSDWEWGESTINF